MSPNDVAITAQPISNAVCQFTVDRPVLPDKSFSFSTKEDASGSPLAERLFDIEGISRVLISHAQVTVTKNSAIDWPQVARAIGAAIREHVATGQAAVSDNVWDKLPSVEEIKAGVKNVLEQEINPSVAQHGGVVHLIDVQDNVVYLQMGGGCQGCGQADVTLKVGIETAIRAAVPAVGDILDVTDHAAGRNPYYTPSKK